MIRIFGITYGDKTTEYEPYLNTATEKLWRFESNPMIEISDNLLSDIGNNDLVGVFSHKFRHKS